MVIHVIFQDNVSCIMRVCIEDFTMMIKHIKFGAKFNKENSIHTVFMTASKNEEKRKIKGMKLRC